MIIRIDGAAPGAVSLEEARDFTRFHIEVRSAGGWEAAHQALAYDGTGRLVDREHGFVAVEGLRRLAGAHADAAWSAELEKMLTYAKKKGWWDEASAAIAAHVVWRASESVE